MSEKHFQKNDTAVIRVTDIGMSGEGIGKADGYTIFARDAVVGDLAEVKIIKAKKHYGYARLLRVIEPSPHRIQPLCAAAGPCGGCQLQNMDYHAQLAWKENMVRNDLIRLGGFQESGPDSYRFLPIVGMEVPFHYRNKAIYPIRGDHYGNLTAGFYALHSHRVIPLVSYTADGVENKTVADECLIGAKNNRPILDAILRWMLEYRIRPYEEEKGTGLIRHVLIRTGFTSGQILVCLAVNANRLPHGDDLASRLSKIEGMTSISYSSNTEKTNVILGSQAVTIWGSDSIEDWIGPVRFSISPLSFFQVNPIQTVRLYQKVMDCASLTGSEVVWDLYCGIGSISLFLAQRAKQVYGVEIVPQAVEDARANAEKNGIHNATFFTGKAEEIVPKAYEREEIRADIVVVDPPRKGCDAILLDTIIKMKPKKIVYVSCNPATLARDLKVLCGGGYKLMEVQPYDLFPHSVHTESVCALEQID
jgi:23S rRNA (uracil1939-C5)-methyltransferase